MESEIKRTAKAWASAWAEAAKAWKETKAKEIKVDDVTDTKVVESLIVLDEAANVRMAWAKAKAAVWAKVEAEWAKTTAEAEEKTGTETRAKIVALMKISAVVEAEAWATVAATVARVETAWANMAAAEANAEIKIAAAEETVARAKTEVAKAWAEAAEVWEATEAKKVETEWENIAAWAEKEEEE